MSDRHHHRQARCGTARIVPRRWSLVAALAIGVQAGCHYGPHQRPSQAAAPPTASGPLTLPPSAFTGGPWLGPNGQVAAGNAPGGPARSGQPLPQMIVGPWKPDGLAGPWPYDEYLHDGGDRESPAMVGGQREIGGLEPEDTVMHYDTIDGRTIVEPSNRVHLYAPRFAAVRKVDRVVQTDLHQPPLGVHGPEQAVHQDELNLVGTATLPIGPEGRVRTLPPSLARSKEPGLALVVEKLAGEVHDGVLPHENFTILHRGVFDQTEGPRLAQYADAAITWTHDKAVQVILDNRSAQIQESARRAEYTFAVDVPNHPKLRVFKVASTMVAQPGEVVDFTIRFDNVGDQSIKNVTLLDNLTPRLEYVPESTQSSRAADFSTQANEGDSLVLRWDFRDELPAGQGGVVRFQCRVR